VGLAGLCGLGIWIAIARHYGMDGPSAGITAVLACGLPMVLWSLAVDKVHRRPSTGIDWAHPRALRETLDTSLVKILGLWTTWAIIALLFLALNWYWQPPYRDVMAIYGALAPWLLVLSAAYIVWLDRVLIDPRDGAHALGLWILGGAGMRDGEAPPPGAIAAHGRAWAVKTFFLTFMIAVVPGNFAEMIHWDNAQIAGNPANLARFLIALLFTIDVAFATVGYVLTLRPLDAHIRSATPHLDGWVAALMCYPPFVVMAAGGQLNYQQDTRDWSYWFDGHDRLLWAWGGLLVLLTGVYAWATIAFGPRFSNLTHRGIITHGPYRLTRHPAYLAKNAFWWLSVLPFLVTTQDAATALRNTLMLAAVSAIYYWRARTEEKHLRADPAYRAYSDWAQAHAPVTRLMARIAGARRGEHGTPIAAE
jgi:protein-S-isoprenylcysteine O-methyltransferase Ste14